MLSEPEASGLDDYNRERCYRKAQIGYVALAHDFHGEGLVITDRERAMASLQPFFADPLQTHAWLRQRSPHCARGAAPMPRASQRSAIVSAVQSRSSGGDINAVIAFLAGLDTVRSQDPRISKPKFW